jgi:CP family cyanate transporter-like MFS transporter
MEQGAFPLKCALLQEIKPVEQRPLSSYWIDGANLPATLLFESNIFLTDQPFDHGTGAPGETPVDTGQPPRAARSVSFARLVLGVSLVLIAFNLRAVFSSLSTVLPEIIRDTGLSAVWASVLTTLPVICLGVFSFPAPNLARRFGAERVIFGSMLLIAFGTGLRGLGLPPFLFLGSFLAGAGIAVVNVLLPGLVKRDFPRNVAMMTGLYTMALCGSAAAAAAFTVPLEKSLPGGWPLALALWGVPALAAALIWAPQALRKGQNAATARPAMRGLFRDPLAWKVTLFMGLQSAMAYIVFGWMAPMLRDRGMESATAGFVLSLCVVFQMLACLAAPALAMRGRDQRWVCLLMLGLAALGFAGCYWLPLPLAWIGGVLNGVGQGGLIAVAMTLIILRSPDIHVAARLSSMAQGVGYILAGFGPLLAGVLRGATGSFMAPTLLFIAFALVAAWSALEAGRNAHVKVQT